MDPRPHDVPLTLGIKPGDRTRRHEPWSAGCRRPGAPASPASSVQGINPVRSPVAAPGRLSARAALLLAVAVLAVSSSAPLVRFTRADPLALAFWRTAGGALLVGGAAHRSAVRPTGRQWLWLAAAGAALAFHFATWLASLQKTSVAASVTLVCSTPIVIAAVHWLQGRPPAGRTWLAIGLAFAGVLVILAGDASGGGGPARAGGGSAPLVGDGLALLGALLMSAYLLIGDRLRVDLPTSVYSAWTYGFAAACLAPVALATGVPLAGFDRRTWLVMLAIVLGPQLAGHTLLNLLLQELGSVTVSLALLAEPIGASLLVWLALGEVPPAAAAVGGPLVILGLALQLLSSAPAS